MYKLLRKAIATVRNIDRKTSVLSFCNHNVHFNSEDVYLSYHSVYSLHHAFLFAGLIYAITALGVAAGYMGGGLFLNLWVDIDKADVDLDKYAHSNEVIELGTY